MTTKKVTKLKVAKKKIIKKIKAKKASAKPKLKPKLILLPEKGAPLVYLDFAIMNGSLRDPEGKDGTASLTMSMLLRGTSKKSQEAFHLALDKLGAEIYMGKFKESLRVYGVVLADKLEPFLELWEEMLSSPAFAEEEFEKIRKQFRSALMDELSSDDDIADRRFQEYLLWGSSYGRMTSGSLQSLDRITTNDLREFHQTYFRSGDFVVGASGGFDKAFLQKRIIEILEKLPAGSAGVLETKAPEIKAGKRFLFIDKPERTQSQIMIGSRGVNYADKDYFAMLIANHVFGGGSFSARLMKEVREKRGWSYGAYSFYRSGKKPLYFAMQTVPSNKDTIPAVNLMLELFAEFAKKGLTKEEFIFAKKSLVNQSSFLQDTLRKRLDNKVTEAVLGLPPGFYDKYRSRLNKLTYADVQKAIKKNVDPSRIFTLVLGTKEHLQSEFANLKNFNKGWVRRFDEEAIDLQKLEPINFRP